MSGFKSALSLGSQAPLSILSGDNPLDEAAVDDAYLEEALRRGANEVDLMMLQWKLQVKKTARQAWRPATGARLLETTDVLSLDPETLRDANKFARQRCMQDHRAAMEAEFARLGVLQSDFRFNNANGTEIDPIVSYSVVRAAMYRAGYDDPVESVFKKIKKGTKLLGKVVGGGLHEKFAEQLASLDAKLNTYAPGLANKISQQFRSVWGFVPRNIAGSSSLSNHAFGLAIDVDPAWNPMVKDPKVIAVLKQITGYDFALPFSPQDVCELPKDQIQQIHKQQQDASSRLRTWLQRCLPAYEARSKKKPPKKSETPELPWTLDSSEDIGESEKKALDTLVGSYDLEGVRAWAEHGIQTVPLEFAVAMKELDFGWGSEYKCKKDVMHFELDFRKTIPRDVNAPRTLESLFDGLSEPVERAVPAKKKASARKAHQP